MNIESLIIEGNKYLHKKDTLFILSILLNKNVLELQNILNEKVSTNTVDKFKKIIRDLNNKIPIQYALGFVNFYGYEFIVNKSVLIPRFETEELVENTIKLILTEFKNSVKILDIGTGSGVIGITIKKKIPNACVTISDISKEALEVASKNMKILNANVKIINSDIFSNINEKYDVIVSNPPYVSINDNIEDIVKKNEPSLALYAQNNGLEYYQKILSECSSYLNEHFLLAFEIGNTQKNEIVNLINIYLSDVRIITKKDLQGRDRMIFVVK